MFKELKMADELENENLSNHLGDRTVARDINFRLSGELVGLGHNISKVKFVPVEDMCVDSRLIHSGFIFSAAAHCALTALNKKNSLIIGSDAKFLAPIELGHEVIFKGEALQDDTKKCEVKVEGFLLDIKVFYGMFYIAVFDKKIFKIKFDE